MIEFTGHLDVALSPNVVFEHLADMTELDRWNPNVTSSERTSGRRFEVGSTYLSTIQRGPMRMVARSTLTQVEPDRSVTYEGSISVLWSVDSLGFESHDGGTRITFFNCTQLPSWLLFLSPILNAAFQPQARKAVEGARRYLHSLAHEV